MNVKILCVINVFMKKMRMKKKMTLTEAITVMKIMATAIIGVVNAGLH